MQKELYRDMKQERDLTDPFVSSRVMIGCQPRIQSKDSSRKSSARETLKLKCLFWQTRWHRQEDPTLSSFRLSSWSQRSKSFITFFRVPYHQLLIRRGCRSMRKKKNTNSFDVLANIYFSLWDASMTRGLDFTSPSGFLWWFCKELFSSISEGLTPHET